MPHGHRALLKIPEDFIEEVFAWVWAENLHRVYRSLRTRRGKTLAKSRREADQDIAADLRAEAEEAEVDAAKIKALIPVGFVSYRQRTFDYELPPEYRGTTRGQRLFHVTVVLVAPSNADQTLAGSWQGRDAVMTLYLPAYVPTFDLALERQQQDLRRTIAHETRHATQTFIAKTRAHEAFDRGEDVSPLFEYTNWLAGFPPKKARQAGGGWAWGSAPHAVRNIEFYTRLGDEVTEAKHEVERSHLTEQPEQLREFLHRWTQSGRVAGRGFPAGPVGAAMYTALSREFFRTLKAQAPTRWQAAVRLFVAEFPVAEHRGFRKVNEKALAMTWDPSGRFWGLPVSAVMGAAWRSVPDWTPTSAAALRDEYAAWVEQLPFNVLLQHKKAVERSGEGQEYYPTARWYELNERGWPTKEPLRLTEKLAEGKERKTTVVEPHPKLAQRGR